MTRVTEKDNIRRVLKCMNSSKIISRKDENRLKKYMGIYQYDIIKKKAEKQLYKYRTNSNYNKHR